MLSSNISRILLIALLFTNLTSMAQTYDRRYIKNLKFRLLITNISEVRTIDTYLIPNRPMDSLGKESLLLKNSPNTLSGFMLQSNNISVYLTSSLPQRQADIDNFGRQTSSIIKAAFLFKGLLSNFTYIEHKGFYDYNYSKHPDFPGDTIPFRRHNASGLRWIGFDISYYKGNRKFCVGIPSYFGERQLKSRFTLGSRIAYNNLRLNNNGKPYFRDSISGQLPELRAASFTYNGFSFSLTPSVYLVAAKTFFCFVDASVGLGVGKLNESNLYTTKLLVQPEIPQAKIAGGIHTDRFLMGLYYTYLNQSFRTETLTIGNILGSYGFVIGIRINPYKYRYLKWDTL